MRQSFFYDFSNYGIYERLTDDGLTQWHPAFFSLGTSLEDCARKYKGFCNRYKPKPKKPTPSKCHWGSKLLAGVKTETEPHSGSKSQKNAPLPRPRRVACQVIENDILGRVVDQFIEANRKPWDGSKGK